MKVNECRMCAVCTFNMLLMLLLLKLLDELIRESLKARVKRTSYIRVSYND